jgi:hypothetical protein
MADEFEDLPDPEFSHFPWSEPKRPEMAPTTRRARRWPLTAEAASAASSPPVEPAPANLPDAPTDVSFDDLPDAPTDVSFDDLPPTYGPGESAIEGFLKGASANWRDEMAGASAAATAGLPESVKRGIESQPFANAALSPIVGAARLAYEHFTKPQKGLSDVITGKEHQGAATREYERARDEVRRREEEMRRQNPLAFWGGEFGGGAASILVAPEAGLARQAVARLGPVAGRVAGSAGAGAGYGALAGAGEGEETAGRASGAVTGGLTGAALGTVAGAAVEAARPLVRAAASRFARRPSAPPPAPAAAAEHGPGVPETREGLDPNVRLLPPETPRALDPALRDSVGAQRAETALSQADPDAVRILENAAREEGWTEHTLDQLEAEQSSHHFLAESSPNFEALTKANQTLPGSARTEINQAVNQRHRERGERINEIHNEFLGHDLNRTQWEAELRRAAEQESAPFWRQFDQQVVQPTPEIDAILQRPTMKSALAKANRTLLDRGEPIENGFPILAEEEAAGMSPEQRAAAEADLQGTRTPTAKAFQLAKEHIDGLIADAVKAGRRGDVRTYTGLKHDLDAAIAFHPNAQTANVWQQARPKAQALARHHRFLAKHIQEKLNAGTARIKDRRK